MSNAAQTGNPTSSSPSSNLPPAINTQTSTTSSSSKPASPAIVPEQKLNYAQAVGKTTTTSGSGTSTPVNQQQPPPSSTGTPNTSSVPTTSTTLPQNIPTGPAALTSNASINATYPNGTAKPVVHPPTGPAASLNGNMTASSSRNHSRASSAASGYRPPPTGPHSSKPSMSGQPLYGGYPVQSPRIPMNNGGRNSPYIEYPEDDRNHRSPPQSRNGSIAGISMARHGSTNSQSGGGGGGGQVPPSPRPNNRPNVSGPYPPPYGYQPPQPPFNPAAAYQQPIPGRGATQFRNPSATTPFQPGGMQQFQRGQPPPRSPQNMPLAPHMYGMQPHMPQVQPMPAPGQYVYPYPPVPPAHNPPLQYMDLTRGELQYIPQPTDQYNPQMQVQGQYMYPPQFHPQQPQPPHGYNPNAPPPQQGLPNQQLFSPPPPQNIQSSYTPQQPPRGPSSMSRSTSVASDMSHPQPVAPPITAALQQQQQQQQPPATPSPAPKDEPSPFVRPKKSSAIKIVNPETKAEVTFTKVASAVRVPERSPSPAVKSSPAKPTVARVTHSPAPSLDVERPASAQKSKEELKEEMKAKIASALVKEQAKKDEAERLEREKKMEEERKAKEEADRVEKERLEEEEQKRKVEEERIKQEQEEAERKAEEERVAAQKAKEEEDARIAEEKAKEEAAAEAARLAREKEEAEAKAKEEAEAKAREEAEAKAKEEAEIAAAAAAATAAALATSGEEMSLEERRPSLGGTRKTAPPPIAIKSDTAIPDGLQSAALKTASFIKQDNFLTTKYPDGFTSPDPAINAKFGPKGFHYNVDFLYQFKDVYRDKPSSDWDTRIKETMGDMDNRQQRPVGGAARTVSTSGFAGHQTMGNFGMGVSKPSARPTTTMTPLVTGYNPINQPFPPRPPRQASTSAQGMQAPASPSARTQSKSQRQNSRRGPPQPPPPPPEPPVEPLPVNPNRWKPQRAAETNLGPPPGGPEASRLAPEVVQRKVKSLLNKLTLEKFDKITDQILEIAGQSRTETDGRTLRQIIQLTFEKATDEPNFSEMYALFCRKIMETIDPNITDPAVLNKDGQPLTGGQLFRKYLLNRCQEEFERGWKVNLPPKPEDNATGKEAELLSEAYYLAAKAKRQGLGLVQFIGELFKLNMLIEKIMYECIIRLLGGTEDPHPEPEEVESLCRLLFTVGKALDEGKAKTRMNAIYDALEHIRQTSDLESRIKFKILDVLDTRKNGWIGRSTGQQGPKTIQEIHDDAAKQKAEQELARQNMPRSRQEFGRGDARLDGWNTAPRPKVDNRVGDMSKVGMIRTSSTGGLGPQTSQFNSMRSMSSRTRNAAGNTLTREGSGQSSRTATPGVSTPPNVTSANSFDIFRNEAESKDDDHLPTTPARVPKVVAPDDEVADGGYYTSPPMTVVASTASVPNFIVGRKGYGTISFKSPVDLTDVASLSILREIVEITRGTVTVYPDESKKPPLGKGLNVPALVTLENVQPPPDFEGDEFIEELRVRPDTEFVSYNVETGEYVFNVEHFSTYSAIPETSAYSSKSTIHSRRSERFWSNQATTVDPSQSLDPGMRRSYLTRADPAERTLKKILLLGTQ